MTEFQGWLLLAMLAFIAAIAVFGYSEVWAKYFVGMSIGSVFVSFLSKIRRR